MPHAAGVIRDDEYCRKCGQQLTTEEFGHAECDVCWHSREPWECGAFYCDEEE